MLYCTVHIFHSLYCTVNMFMSHVTIVRSFQVCFTSFSERCCFYLRLLLIVRIDVSCYLVVFNRLLLYSVCSKIVHMKYLSGIFVLSKREIVSLFVNQKHILLCGQIVPDDLIYENKVWNSSYIDKRSPTQADREITREIME